MKKSNDYLILRKHCDFVKRREWGALKWFLEMSKENQIKYALRYYREDDEL